MPGPLFSTLSPSEIGRAAWDDATGTLKTSLQAVIVGVQQEVSINAADDSVVAFQPNGASLHVFVDNFASLSISVTAGSTVTVANPFNGTVLQGTNPWIVGGTVTIANPSGSGATVFIGAGVTATVANFPSVQAVTFPAFLGPIGITGSVGVTFGGVTVTVSNPVAAGQTVTIANSSLGVTFGGVTISNFPAVQSVTLPIGLTVFQGSSAWIVGGTASIANFPSDDNVAGSLGATNAAVTITTQRHSSVYFNIGGSFVQTLLFEAQAGDGVWNNVAAINQNNGIFFFVTVPNVSFIVPVGGFNQFRVRCAAYTSGTALITMNAGDGANVVEIFQPVATALQASVNGLAATNAPALTSTSTSPLSLNVRGHLRTKWGGGDSSITIRNDYSASMVSTAAYFQLSVSTTTDINRLHIFDSSGQDFVLAVGASGSEVDQVQISPGGWDSGLDLWIPSGSRLSLKSKGTTASSGILLITGLK